jgi:hypothetical protein
MKTYHVKVTFTQLEIYRIQAEDEEEAENLFAEGTLIHTDDEAIDCTVLSVEEVKP